MNKETLATDLVERARAMGADAAEVFISESTALSIEMRLGKVETIENAGTTGLGLRVLKGGATALTSTRDLSEDSLDELLRETDAEVRCLVRARDAAAASVASALRGTAPRRRRPASSSSRVGVRGIRSPGFR